MIGEKRATELLLAVKSDSIELQELVSIVRLGFWAKNHAIPALEYYADEREGAQRARDALMDQFRNKP